MKIHPYIEGIDGPLFKNRGFRINQLDIDQLPHGWIRLHIWWGADKEEWKFKHPTLRFSGFGGNENTLTLEFRELKTKCPLGNTIKVGIRNGKSDSEFISEASFKVFNKYSFVFMENHKYGVNIFWNDGRFNSGQGEKNLYTSLK
jgi:hypothetical protein